MPAVVGEILFGVVIGPQVMGLLVPAVTLDMIAELGLAFLFLIAGFEINPIAVRGQPTRLAIRGWMASFSVAGMLVLSELRLGPFPAAGFFAVAISTTVIGTCCRS